MKNKILCSLIILTASITLFAQKPITGAFGFELGKKIPSGSVLRKVDEFTHLVKVQKPFSRFSLYGVEILPSTGQIYAIIASYSTEDKTGAQEYDRALSALEKIYGKFQQSGHEFRKFAKLDRDGNTILIRYERPSYKLERVMIMYINNPLMHRAEEEKKAIQLKKTDSSML